MKVFLDTNVIIDFLLKREPHYTDSKKVFDMCLYKIDGCVTPHFLIDVFYMLSERTDATEDYCRETILKLRSVLTVIAEDSERVLLAAKNEEFSDFEDSMQNEAAKIAGVDCIITRNTKDFKNSKIPVYTPTEFLSSSSHGL